LPDIGWRLFIGENFHGLNEELLWVLLSQIDNGFFGLSSFLVEFACGCGLN
jgi:hypothetical protein